MKNRIEIPGEEPVQGRRSRRHRDAEPQAPKAEAPRKWTEREGYFQGAKVRRR